VQQIDNIRVWPRFGE